MSFGDNSDEPPDDECCTGCGDPLPVDALQAGVEFCSDDCKTDYFEQDDT